MFVFVSVTRHRQQQILVDLSAFKDVCYISESWFFQSLFSISSPLILAFVGTVNVNV